MTFYFYVHRLVIYLDNNYGMLVRIYFFDSHSDSNKDTRNGDYLFVFLPFMEKARKINGYNRFIQLYRLMKTLLISYIFLR